MDDCGSPSLRRRPRAVRGTAAVSARALVLEIAISGIKPLQTLSIVIFAFTAHAQVCRSGATTMAMRAIAGDRSGRAALEVCAPRLRPTRRASGGRRRRPMAATPTDGDGGRRSSARARRGRSLELLFDPSYPPPRAPRSTQSAAGGAFAVHSLVSAAAAAAAAAAARCSRSRTR